MTTDDVSGFDVPQPTTPTSDGSSEREALIDLIVGMDHDAATLADLILAAGFTRAHGETVADLLAIELQRMMEERDEAETKLTEAVHAWDDARATLIRERDEARAHLEVEREWCRKIADSNNAKMQELINLRAERDALAAQVKAYEADEPNVQATEQRAAHSRGGFAWPT